MRVALYIRVSTQEQAQHGLSLEDQKESLLQYAKENELTVVGVYEDAGISARKSYKKRPAMLRLLEDCKAKKIDMVLFIKLDRWFRNVADYYEVQPILEKNKVAWRATLEDYETVTASGRFKVNIMLSVAQDEADRTSERIKFANQAKRERKEALTGQMPYGYKLNGVKIVKDPETEKIIEGIFNKYAETGSITRTQEYIQEEYGVHLTYWKIDGVLRSEAYIGTYYDTPGMCPAYITPEEHDRLLDMRRKVVRWSPENRVYPFSGLLVCGECGTRFCAKFQPAHNYAYYTCAKRNMRAGDCANGNAISQKKIERYFVDALDAKVKKYKMEAKKAKPVDNSQKINALEVKMKKLKDLYINDLISLNELQTDKRKYEAQIQAYKNMEMKKPDFSTLDRLLSGDWKTMYWESSPAAKAKFWRKVIKEGRVYADRHIEFDLNV